MSIIFLTGAIFLLLLGAGWEARSATILLAVTIVPPALWFFALQQSLLVNVAPVDLFLRYAVFLGFLGWGLAIMER